MSCNNCNKDKDAAKTVSWAYVELLNDGHKSTIKRLWVTILVLIGVIVVLMGGFVYEHLQYDYTDIEYTQDGKGVNIIGDYNDAKQNYESDAENTKANP